MRTDRLKKLANHLLNKELGHDEFDFGVFSKGHVFNEDCGTRGCAVGECPIIWPKQWKFDENNELPKLRTLEDPCPIDHAAEWFDLTLKEARRLFSPTPNGLRSKATKDEVAEEILALVKEYEDGKDATSNRNVGAATS